MPLAVDSHAHVFLRSDPTLPGARYRSDYDARLEDWLALQDAHGITHGVLVQVSFLGTDNSRLLAALEAAPERLRATVQAGPGVPAATLAAWHARGVRGIRFNVAQARERPDPAASAWRAQLARIADLGWHVEVHDSGASLAAFLGRLAGCPAPVIVDHFGHGGEGLEATLRFAERHAVYAKLSAAYRIAPADPRAAAGRLLAALGAGRLMWGSDWPHTRHERAVRYADTRRALDEWIADPAARRRILWDTPARLFGFAPLSAPRGMD